jgi:hypothetical protein
MEKSWNRCGPDTLHVTFKEGAYRSPEDFASLLQEFQVERDLPTNAIVRDRGVSGFENSAIDQAAGLRLDWTKIGGEGSNAGYFCLQVKGEWFDQADGPTTVDLIQLLDAYGTYRVTRVDIQQTVVTKKYLTPWWITAFDAGALRVIGKKYYEPRGKKSSSDMYPAGATLYHGSRTSERFARQYDRHKKVDVGPPRRRDEIEIKGDSCRRLWDELLGELAQGEQTDQARADRLAAFSKGAIRAYLPIRDTSRWLGKELPKNWAQLAEEPMNWSELFEQEALGISPAPKRITSLLKSYRYASENFGAAVSVTAAKAFVEGLQRGETPQEASNGAYCQLMDDFVLGANEQRAREFIAELPRSIRDQVEEHWMGLLANAASNAERVRDEGLG